MSARGRALRLYPKIPFDGDTGSATLVMSNEALDENDKLLSSRQYWVDTDGSLLSSYNYDTIKYVIANMTGRFKHGRAKA